MGNQRPKNKSNVLLLTQIRNGKNGVLILFNVLFKYAAELGKVRSTDLRSLSIFFIITNNNIADILTVFNSTEKTVFTVFATALYLKLFLYLYHGNTQLFGKFLCALSLVLT